MNMKVLSVVILLLELVLGERVAISKDSTIFTFCRNLASVNYNYTLDSGESMTFTSPNHPYNYPHCQYITWNFYHSYENGTLDVYCPEFSIAGGVNCFADYLAYWLTGDPEDGGLKSCGYYPSLSFASIADHLVTAFVSNNIGTSTGFSCTVTASQVTKTDCECGIKNLQGKIVNGEETYPGEHPWQILLYLSTPVRRYMCGGTLISNQWVLTAAHCLLGVDPLDIEVYLGLYKLSGPHDDVASSSVTSCILHRGYNRRNQDNDIALVKLAQPVNYTDSISPACLPFQYAHSSLSGKVATASGWGSTSYTGKNSDILLQIDMEIFERTDCGFSPLSDYLTDNMLCGYTEGKDSCQGDSGGPLIHEEEYRNYVVGLTSWGYECAVKNYPGVYTRVSNYLTWIQDNTGITFCHA